MATPNNATRQAPPAKSSPDAPPVVQGQVIDPEKLPLDSQKVRYRPPAGAKHLRVRAKLAGTSGGRYREPNEVFDLYLLPEEKLPRWVEVLSGEEQRLEQNPAAEVPLMSHLTPDA